MPEHLRVMHPEVQDGGSVPFWELFEVTQQERILLGVSSDVLFALQKYTICAAATKGKARVTKGQAGLRVAGLSTKWKRPMDSDAARGSKRACS